MCVYIYICICIYNHIILFQQVLDVYWEHVLFARFSLCYVRESVCVICRIESALCAVSGLRYVQFEKSLGVWGPRIEHYRGPIRALGSAGP